MRKYLFLCLALLVTALGGRAQLVSTSPAILQESSRDIVLTYHADSPLGNMGLANLPSSTDVYAHIGVITNFSSGNSDWKYAPSWGDNSAKYKLDQVSANTYTLSIGDLRTYFGVSDADEKIERLAIVFRTADSSKEGKTATGGDIFVEVQPNGFRMNFSSTATSTVLSKPASISFTAAATEPATLTIDVNGTTVKTATQTTELTATYDFNTYGNYVVTATAQQGSTTLTRTISINYPRPSEAGVYPGGVPKMGPVKNADGSVTFCLAAPGKNSVVLVPSWDNYAMLDKNTMKYQDYEGQRYFFTTVSGLADDEYYSYYFNVDATHNVGDPYARLVLDPYSDKWLDESIWPEMPQYPYDRFDNIVLAVWRGDMDTDFTFSDFEIPDHRNLIVYELLLRDFTGTEGKADANGTFRKALAKIPYLKSLGVNVVELLPIMEFNGNNSWGYNTNFYFAPDKAYGSPLDVKTFVEECHRNGMAVVLDVAFNHSDGLHPWYQMYDINDNPFYNKTAPHAYSVLNDYKQQNPLVRQQEKDCIRHWMTVYNVDGFRFDLVKGLGTEYASSDDAGTNAYNHSRVVVMADLHSAIREVKENGIHINENLAGQQEENEMAADGELNWANINNAASQSAMGYTDNSSLNVFAPEYYGRTPYSIVSYAESHDEERLAYRQEAYGASGVKGNETKSMLRLGQVAVEMLMAPSAKMIWQFSEMGNAQSTKNDTGNDTSPKTVNWDALNNDDVKELVNIYSTMIGLRRDNPGLFTEGTTVYNDFGNTMTARTIKVTNGSKEIIAFVNPGISGTATAKAMNTVMRRDDSKLVLASRNFANPQLLGSGSTLTMRVPANGFAVFATNNLSSGVSDITTDGADSGVRVYGAVGEILIEGTYGEASVYNLTGQRQNSLKVAPGLYIVNVDGKSTKVSVR